METVVCPLCGADRSLIYAQTADLIYGTPGQFTFVRCAECDLIYQNPRPAPDAMITHYPGMDYHAFREAGGLTGRIRRALRRAEARSLLLGLPEGAKILEIGAGTGDLLAALRDAGADAVGYEPNPAALAVARMRGLSVSDDQAAIMAAAPFDGVVMQYVLEHVPNLRETVFGIGQVLKPGGRAVFWVPNAASWDARLFGGLWRGLDAPRHLQIFTPQTMRRLLEGAGLTMQSVQYIGVPNDWAGSAGFWLRARLERAASAKGNSNNSRNNSHGSRARRGRGGGLHPLALVAWLPISLSAARFRAAGRIRVTGVRL